MALAVSVVSEASVVLAQWVVSREVSRCQVLQALVLLVLEALEEPEVLAVQALVVPEVPVLVPQELNLTLSLHWADWVAWVEWADSIHT